MGGIGPAPAIKSLLSKTDLSLSSISRVEVNEAFAAQYLAVEKELELDRSKVNIHGGAISIGHPLAASGSRILAHLAHEFNSKNNNEGMKLLLEVHVLVVDKGLLLFW